MFFELYVIFQNRCSFIHNYLFFIQISFNNKMRYTLKNFTIISYSSSTVGNTYDSQETFECSLNDIVNKSFKIREYIN